MDGPAPSKRRRASRKTDAQRGELGVWAYNTMVDLGLSDVQIASEVGASAATIRKIMGGSERHPSARLLRAIHRYFVRVGGEADPPIPIDRPPGLSSMESPGGATAPGLSDLTDALVAQAETFAKMLEVAMRRDDSVESRIRALRAEVRSLRSRLGDGASPTQPTPHERAG